MEHQQTRVRISLKTGEFEVEGTEEFVREFKEEIQEMLERLESPLSTGNSLEDQTGSEQEEIAPDTAVESLPDTFGAYYQKFPKLSNTDKVLVAAHFAQAHSSDSTFTTREANKLLKEQGVKVANATKAITDHRNRKRVFVVKSGRFRISEGGHDYIESRRSK